MDWRQLAKDLAGQLVRYVCPNQCKHPHCKEGKELIDKCLSDEDVCVIQEPLVLTGLNEEESDLSEIGARVFSYYLEKIGKSSKLCTYTAKKEKMFNCRFRDILKRNGNDYVRAEQVMMVVIDALAASDFHNARGKSKGQAKYNDWDVIFRSTDQFEKWMERT